MSVAILHVQYQASMYQLNWVEPYELIQLFFSGYFGLIPHSLFLIVIYDPMLFPSPPLGRW